MSISSHREFKHAIGSALNECRMLILGGQVLIGFSAEAVLEPGFEGLSPVGRSLCAAAMLALVAAVGLFMWPAAYHRIVCDGRADGRLERFINKVLSLGPIVFGAGLASSLGVVADRLLGWRWALVTLGGAMAVCLGAWRLYPLLARQSSFKDHLMPSPAGSSPEPKLSDQIHQVLTEARMVLPGAQALLGFGTLATLMDAFARLPGTLKVVHIVGLGFITLAIVLLMTPAAYHRIVERGGESERFHRIASRLLLAAMAALVPGFAAGVWIVVERATGSRPAAVVAGGGVVIALYGMWFGWTGLLRRARGRAG